MKHNFEINEFKYTGSKELIVVYIVKETRDGVEVLCNLTTYREHFYPRYDWELKDCMTMSLPLIDYLTFNSLSQDEAFDVQKLKWKQVREIEYGEKGGQKYCILTVS